MKRQKKDNAQQAKFADETDTSQYLGKISYGFKFNMQNYKNTP